MSDPAKEFGRMAEKIVAAHMKKIDTHVKNAEKAQDRMLSKCYEEPVEGPFTEKRLNELTKHPAREVAQDARVMIEARKQIRQELDGLSLDLRMEFDRYAKDSKSDDKQRTGMSKMLDKAVKVKGMPIGKRFGLKPNIKFKKSGVEVGLDATLLFGM